MVVEDGDLDAAVEVAEGAGSPCGGGQVLHPGSRSCGTSSAAT
jgi:hypothetical protein